MKTLTTQEIEALGAEVMQRDADLLLWAKGHGKTLCSCYHSLDSRLEEICAERGWSHKEVRAQIDKDFSENWETYDGCLGKQIRRKKITA